MVNKMAFGDSESLCSGTCILGTPPDFTHADSMIPNVITESLLISFHRNREDLERVSASGCAKLFQQLTDMANDQTKLLDNPFGVSYVDEEVTIGVMAYIERFGKSSSAV